LYVTSRLTKDQQLKLSSSTVVNARPLAPSPLHKLINDRFSQSSFSRHAASHLVAPLATSPSKQQAQLMGTKASRKSPKKGTERFPIFLLNLVAPPGTVDVTLEPEKRVVEFEVRCIGLMHFWSSRD